MFIGFWLMGPFAAGGGDETSVTPITGITSITGIV